MFFARTYVHILSTRGLCVSSSAMACKRKTPASSKLTDFFSQPGTSSATHTEDEGIAEDPVALAKRVKHRVSFNPVERRVCLASLQARRRYVL